jgi:hypothetical protein
MVKFMGDPKHGMAQVVYYRNAVIDMESSKLGVMMEEYECLDFIKMELRY